MSSLANLDNISAWKGALWDQHRQPYVGYRDHHVVAYALARRLAPSDSLSASDWEFLIDDGFHHAVLGILNDGFLCGLEESSFRASGLESELELAEHRKMLETRHIVSSLAARVNLTFLKPFGAALFVRHPRSFQRGSWLRGRN